MQEQEDDLAMMANKRNQVADDKAQQLEESDRASQKDLTRLRGQVQQLTADFKYNLKLLKDRDTELELLESQLATSKEASQKHKRVCSWTPCVCASLQNVTEFSTERYRALSFAQDWPSGRSR
jgi:chromosome segregation ATPase